MTTMKHKVGGLCEVEGCGRSHYGRGLCKKHHQRAWKRGALLARPVTLREKIEKYSVPVTESGCWIWTRLVNNKGYGRVSVGQQKSAYAHRVAYAEFKGDAPDGLEVCHRCDTPSCVNPDHLFLGDHQENMTDASLKGRMRTTPLHGSAHPMSKLTDEQVAHIRNSSMPATHWARALGLHPETIRRVRKGTSHRVSGAQQNALLGIDTQDEAA